MHNKEVLPQFPREPKQQVKIQRIETTENRCTLSKDVFQRLKLSPLKSYRFNVGQLSTKVFINATEEEGGQLNIPEHILDRFNLSPDGVLNIWKHDSTIDVGPVVGVLVHPRYIAQIRKGNPPLSARKHMQANEQAHCFTYYFSPEQVDWSLAKAKGCLFDAQKRKWKGAWFPLPTIVYDRGLGFGQQEEEQVNEVRQRLMDHPRVQFINNGSLGKWALYEGLRKHETINQHLPQTILYTGFDAVQHMLEEHGYIFLKSFYGYHGREVMCIEKRRRKYIVHLIYKGLKKLKLESEPDLKRCVQQFVREKPFIVQQGIRVLRVNGSNMDIRLLLVKDRCGEWKVIYNRARLAEGSFPIINSALAHDIVAYDDLFASLSRSMSTHSLPSDRHLRTLTTDIALNIEQELGPFGEMGVDMAIDERGQPWFIEANSKPNKNPQPKLEDIKGISPQFLSVLEYAKCLERVNRH